MNFGIFTSRVLFDGAAVEIGAIPIAEVVAPPAGGIPGTWMFGRWWALLIWILINEQ